MQRALKPEGFELIEQQEAGSSGKPVLLTVRHPLERLVSAWAYFRDHRHSSVPEECYGAGFERFLEITEQHDNAHWRSQVELHTDERGFVPTILTTIDRLTNHWAWPQTARLGRHRTSEHGDWRSYFDAELLRAQLLRCADDLELYHETKRKAAQVRGYS